MRSRKFVFVLGLVVFGALGLMLLGCSSDDTPTSRSTTNPDYTLVVNEVNKLVDTSLSLVGQRLILVSLGNQQDSFQKLPDILMSTFGIDSVTQGDGWLVMYDADLGAAYSNYYLDSIQFRDGQAILPTGVGADRMTVKRYWKQTTLDTTQSFTNYDMVGQFTFTGVNTSQINVNATMTFGVESKDDGVVSTIYRNCNITGSMSSLAVSPGGSGSSSGCPTSGSCQVTVGLETQRDSHLADESEWEIMLSFEAGMASAVVTSATLDTTYTQEFCSFE